MKSKASGAKEQSRRDNLSVPGSEAELRSQGSLLDLKRILVPIDFSPTSLRTLRSVIPFARRFGAVVTLVNIVERAEYAGAQNQSHVAHEAELVHMAKEHLRMILETELSGLVHGEAHVRIGRPFLEIVAFARLHAIDLIVIGPYGQSHLGQAILGSTAEKVLRHAPCPVLALHERELPFL